jgi:hypothetical protein
MSIRWNYRTFLNDRRNFDEVSRERGMRIGHPKRLRRLPLCCGHHRICWAGTQKSQPSINIKRCRHISDDVTDMVYVPDFRTHF